ncbi:uncharacterized protein FIBRA_01514 [Fibroporia radiculosa]|uniref:F-box domain-containing protein n=1 Tax=Fibroporia radiculosa TaxID=599839 RepID=J4I8J0_9APHY|nr:uncharacterized protein FIBRA_01514 [Fibroporia radiculosa]CCL99496.1 predicted protein [Fibroporia radiculosa]
MAHNELERITSDSSLLRLNEDILTEIVSYLHTRDALHLSTTARGLHQVAKRQALSEIWLFRPEETIRICTYMLADIQGRIMCVRKLSVRSHGIGEYHDQASTHWQLLADFLEHAHNLRSLCIFPIGFLLQAVPRMGDALAKLQYLQDIDLGGVDAASLKILPCMRSNIRKIKIHAHFNAFSFEHLILNISSMQSIQELDSELSINRWTQPPIPPAFTDCQLPKLRRLAVPSNTTTMSTCVRAFPELRVLHLGGQEISPEVNVVSALTACWPSLDVVQAHVTAFRRWPITCPVHTLFISGVLAMPSIQVQWDSTEDGALFLPIVLNAVTHTSPIVLKLSIMPYIDLAPTFWTDLAEIGTQIRCLIIQLCEFQDALQFQADLVEWMNTVPPILASMRSLTHIQICIRGDMSRHFSCVVQAYDPDNPPPPPPIAIVPTYEIAQEFSKILIKNLPSVRLVSVGFGFGFLPDGSEQMLGGGSFWWWKTVITPNGRNVQRIEDQAGINLQSRLCSVEFDSRLDFDRE